MKITAVPYNQTKQHYKSLYFHQRQVHLTPRTLAAPTKVAPGFKSGFLDRSGSRSLADHTQNVTDLFLCQRQSFCQVAWKVASDCIV